MNKYRALIGLPVVSLLAVGVAFLYHDPIFLGNLAIGVAFVAIALFVLRYTMTRWEASAEGRHMMAFSLVVTALLGWVVVTLFFLDATHPAWGYTRVGLYTGLVYVLVWRDLMLFAAQREKRHAAQQEKRDAAKVGSL